MRCSMQREESSRICALLPTPPLLRLRDHVSDRHALFTLGLVPGFERRTGQSSLPRVEAEAGDIVEGRAESPQQHHDVVHVGERHLAVAWLHSTVIVDRNASIER